VTDSHTHVIRGGLNYNMELRWDGVRSLHAALEMLKAQARVTPPPQWVRVVGGWNETQFAEKRLPTLKEINQAAPDTPVFVLNLYNRAFLNRAALRAVGYTRDTPQPPPVKRMIEMGLPVTLGTDATRVNSYNPWRALYWLVSGRSIGGTVLYPQERRLDRQAALGLMTASGAWFSRDSGRKGVLKPGALGDVAVLDRDYFSVPEDQIQDIVSLLTVVAGQVVYGAQRFGDLAPALPPASPSWSPVRKFGGYQARKLALGESDRRYQYAAACACRAGCAFHGHDHLKAASTQVPVMDAPAFWGALGCSCYV
jgi:predicted amidohydrolase YtcJ